MRKTDALIIMDGFGYRTNEHGNAVYSAKTPFIDSLYANAIPLSKQAVEPLVFPKVKWETVK